MRGFRVRAIHAIGISKKALSLATCNDGGIVGIRHHRALRGGFVGVADHAEQGFTLRLPVDSPGGIENFVAAVFAVGLRKHHQLHVSGRTSHGRVSLEQVIDFIFAQGQAQFTVRFHQ